MSSEQTTNRSVGRWYEHGGVQVGIACLAGAGVTAIAVIFGCHLRAKIEAPLRSNPSAAGYVRVVNLTPAALDLTIEGAPQAPIRTGDATPYWNTHARLVQVHTADSKSAWPSVFALIASARHKSLFVLGPRRRFSTLDDPVSVKGGGTTLQTVNACASAVRFSVRRENVRSKETKTETLSPQVASTHEALAPGVYCVRAESNGGLALVQKQRLEKGRGYTAVAFEWQGRPQLVVIDNSASSTVQQAGAYRCGPVIALVLQND